MITHIHHINFIVRDLDVAVQQFQRRLGLGPFTMGTLSTRGVKTAQVKLGDSWLVLVQPTRPDSIPGQFLEKNGEGFFLISLGTDDLDAQLAKFERSGTSRLSQNKRQGLDNWQVSDLPPTRFLAVSFNCVKKQQHPPPSPKTNDHALFSLHLLEPSTKVAGKSQPHAPLIWPEWGSIG